MSAQHCTMFCCCTEQQLLAQVYRDKAGKRVTLEELKAQQAANKKPVAETPVWGGGMAQQRAAEQRRHEMHAEAAKPFARRRHAPSLYRHLCELHGAGMFVEGLAAQ